MTETDDKIQFRIDEERAEYINEQRDSYYQAWKNDNIKYLESEFCKDNDDFESYCKEQFKEFGDD